MLSFGHRDLVWFQSDTSGWPDLAQGHPTGSAPSNSHAPRHFFVRQGVIACRCGPQAVLRALLWGGGGGGE